MFYVLGMILLLNADFSLKRPVCSFAGSHGKSQHRPYLAYMALVHVEIAMDATPDKIDGRADRIYSILIYLIVLPLPHVESSRTASYELIIPATAPRS